MATLTETTHAGGFILSEANGNRSREKGVLAEGNKLDAGTVVGKVTVGGAYTILAPAAEDGSEAAAGILYGAVDATSADAACAVVVRDAEVNANELVWPAGINEVQKAAAIAELAALGIIVR